MAGHRSFAIPLLLLTILSISIPALAAPYLKTVERESQKQVPLDHIFQPSQGLIGPLFRQNDHSVHPTKEGGCYYQFRHYDEGDRIITNEPCLNCTCHNSMLMCYLKVCPFSKPIGQDCTVEKSPNQCCPVITCPQVPVNLQVMHMMPPTTTPSPYTINGMVPYTEHGCTIDGDYYPDGAQVPGNPMKPCELCYCIRNHTACLMQECILKVDGCEPVFKDRICCPVRYKCAHDEWDEIAATTLSPNGTLTTTLQPSSTIGGCTHIEQFYADGALIPSDNPCEHCYCMKTDIVCAIQECRSPLDEDDEKCVPRPSPPGQCCPEAYDCPEVPEITIPEVEALSTLAPMEIVFEDKNDTLPVSEKEDAESFTTTPSGDEATTAEMHAKPATLPDGIDLTTQEPQVVDEMEGATTSGYEESEDKEIKDKVSTVSSDDDTKPELTTPAIDTADISTKDPKPAITEDVATLLETLNLTITDIMSDESSEKLPEHQTTIPEKPEITEKPFGIPMITESEVVSTSDGESKVTESALDVETQTEDQISDTSPVPESTEEMKTEVPDSFDKTTIKPDTETAKEHVQATTESVNDFVEPDEVTVDTEVAHKPEEATDSPKEEEVKPDATTKSPEIVTEDLDLIKEVTTTKAEPIKTEMPIEENIEITTAEHDPNKGIEIIFPTSAPMPQPPKTDSTTMISEMIPESHTDQIALVDEVTESIIDVTEASILTTLKHKIVTTESESTIIKDPSEDDSTTVSEESMPSTKSTEKPEVQTDVLVDTAGGITEIDMTDKVTTFEPSMSLEETKSPVTTVQTDKVVSEESTLPIDVVSTDDVDGTETQSPVAESVFTTQSESVTSKPSSKPVQHEDADMTTKAPHPIDELTTVDDLTDKVTKEVFEQADESMTSKPEVSTETEIKDKTTAQFEYLETTQESTYIHDKTKETTESIQMTTTPSSVKTTDHLSVDVTTQAEDFIYTEDSSKTEDKHEITTPVQDNQEITFTQEIADVTEDVGTDLLEKEVTTISPALPEEVDKEISTTSSTLPETDLDDTVNISTLKPVVEEPKIPDFTMEVISEEGKYTTIKPIKDITDEDTATTDKIDIETETPELVTVDSIPSESPETDIDVTTYQDESTYETTKVYEKVTTSKEESDVVKVTEAPEIGVTTDSDDEDSKITISEKEPIKDITTQEPIVEMTTLSAEKITTHKVVATTKPETVEIITETLEDKEMEDVTTPPIDTITSDSAGTTASVDDKEHDVIKDSTTILPEEQKSSTEGPLQVLTTLLPQFLTTLLFPEEHKTETIVVTTEGTLEPEKDTEVDSSVATDAPSFPKGACMSNGTIYLNNDSVPVFNKCQEQCKCKDGVVSCQFIACPSPPPMFLRCDVRQSLDECCPTYECPTIKPDELPSQNCIRNETQYLEGEFVPSKDLCTDCYCLFGEIICAFQECPSYDERCKPLETQNGSCCPSKYECPELEVDNMIAATTVSTQTQTDSEDKETDVEVEITTVDSSFTDKVVDKVTSKPTIESDVTESAITEVETEKSSVATEVTEEPPKVTTQETDKDKETITQKPDDHSLGTETTLSSTSKPTIESDATESAVTEVETEKLPVATEVTEETPMVTTQEADKDKEIITQKPDHSLGTETTVSSTSKPTIESDVTESAVTEVVTEKFPVATEGTEKTPMVTTQKTDKDKETITQKTDDHSLGIETTVSSTPIEETSEMEEDSHVTTIEPEIEIETSEKTTTLPEDVKEVTDHSHKPEISTDITKVEEKTTVEAVETTTQGKMPEEVSEMIEQDDTTDTTDITLTDDKLESITTTPDVIDVQTTFKPDVDETEPAHKITTTETTKIVEEITTQKSVEEVEEQTVPGTTSSSTDEVETQTIEEDEVGKISTEKPELDVEEITTIMPVEEMVTEIATQPQPDIEEQIITEEKETPQEDETETTTVLPGLIDIIMATPSPKPVDEIITTKRPFVPGDGYCTLNGALYKNGDYVPLFSPCQEKCKCVDSEISCQVTSCPSPPPAFLNCSMIQNENECCASYECPVIQGDDIPSPSCFLNEIQYYEGDFVQSNDSCKDCYCLYGEIICATQECPTPSEHCVPIERLPGRCCPTKYECGSTEEVTEMPDQAKTQPPIVESSTLSTELPIEIMTEKPLSEVTDVPSEDKTIESLDLVIDSQTTMDSISTEVPPYSEEPKQTEATTIRPSVHETSKIPVELATPAHEVTTKKPLIVTEMSTPEKVDHTTDKEISELTTGDKVELEIEKPIVDETPITTEEEILEVLTDGTLEVTEKPIPDIDSEKLISSTTSITDTADMQEDLTTVMIPTEQSTSSTYEMLNETTQHSVVEKITTVKIPVSVTQLSMETTDSSVDGIDMTTVISLEGDTISEDITNETVSEIDAEIIDTVQTTDLPSGVTTTKTTPTEIVSEIFEENLGTEKPIEFEEITTTKDTPTTHYVTDETDKHNITVVSEVEIESVTDKLEVSTSSLFDDTTASELLQTIYQEFTTEALPAETSSKQEQEKHTTELPIQFEIVETTESSDLEEKEEEKVILTSTKPFDLIDVTTVSDITDITVTEDGSKVSTDLPGDKESQTLTTEDDVLEEEVSTVVPVTESEKDKETVTTSKSPTAAVSDLTTEDELEDTTITPISEEHLTDVDGDGNVTHITTSEDIDDGSTFTTEISTEKEVEGTESAILTSSKSPLEEEITKETTTIEDIVDEETLVSTTVPLIDVPELTSKTPSEDHSEQTTTTSKEQEPVTDSVIVLEVTTSTEEDKMEEPLMTTAVPVVDLSEVITEKVDEKESEIPSVTVTTSPVDSDVTEKSTVNYIEDKEAVVTTISPIITKVPTEEKSNETATESEGEENLITTSKSPVEEEITKETTAIEDTVDEEKLVTTTVPLIDEPEITTKTPSEDHSDQTTTKSKEQDPVTDSGIEMETTTLIEDDKVEETLMTTAVPIVDLSEVTTEEETGKESERPTVPVTSSPIVTEQSTDDVEENETVVTTVSSIIDEVEKTTIAPIEKMTTLESAIEKESNITEPSAIETMPTEHPTTEIETKPEVMEGQMIKSCFWFDHKVYEHGTTVAPNDECQEACVCNNGTVSCEYKACPAVPPSFLRCEASYNNDTCCPVYECNPDPKDQFCFHGGMIYKDGDYVPSNTQCVDCYCVEGGVVCATLECGVPRDNCSPIQQLENECCPIRYECNESIASVEDYTTTESDILGVTNATVVSEHLESSTSLPSASHFTAKPNVTEEKTTIKLPVTTEEIEKIITEFPALKPMLTEAPITSIEEDPVHPEEPEKITSKEPVDGIKDTKETTTTGRPFPPFPGGDTPYSTNQTSTTERPLPPFPSYQGGNTPYATNQTTTWRPTTTAEIVLGPGSCFFDGRVYVSAEQIPRDDPCDFCFCFRGDIICLQQTCPPPIPGCYEEAIPGFCCPRYECPVRQSLVNVTSTTPSPYPGFPARYTTSTVAMCEIEGRYYASGDIVASASSPCHECRCGNDGFMKCVSTECGSQRKIYKYGYR